MSKQFKNIPECVYGNQCEMVCINAQCRKPGFVCESGERNRDCCALFHENCEKMKWTELESILYSNQSTKIPEFSKLQDEMENFFHDMIKKIKEEHVKFKIWSRTYGYPEELMNFMHLVNEGNYNQISGLSMSQVLSSIFMKEEKKFEESFNLDNIRQVTKQIGNLFSHIRSIYQTPSSKLNSVIESAKLSSNTLEPLIDSKISTDFENLRSQFGKRSVKKFQLIFRASDNDFSVAKFHEKCDNVQDTMLLVKTEYGKILGGYTPLAWNSSKKHWAADKSLRSFIFSLDLEERFQLNLAQFAVACNPEKGPIFGCCDICIVDKSNVEKSNAEFPISYNNFKYARNSDTSIAFTGSSKGRFCTKEWEIFKVTFDQE